MRGLNLKEIMSKSNMNQQGLNIATYGQAYYNQVSVTTNIKDSGLILRIQDGDEENSAGRRNLRANKGKFADREKRK